MLGKAGSRRRRRSAEAATQAGRLGVPTSVHGSAAAAGTGTVSDAADASVTMTDATNETEDRAMIIAPLAAVNSQDRARGDGVTDAAGRLCSDGSRIR